MMPLCDRIGARVFSTSRLSTRLKWVAAVAAINDREKQPKDEEADTKLQSAFSLARKLQKDVQESRRVAQYHVCVVHELGLQPGPGYVHAKMMIIDDEVLHV